MGTVSHPSYPPDIDHQSISNINERFIISLDYKYAWNGSYQAMILILWN